MTRLTESEVLSRLGVSEEDIHQEFLSREDAYAGVFGLGVGLAEGKPSLIQFVQVPATDRQSFLAALFDMRVVHASRKIAFRRRQSSLPMSHVFLMASATLTRNPLLCSQVDSISGNICISSNKGEGTLGCVIQNQHGIYGLTARHAYDNSQQAKLVQFAHGQLAELQGAIDQPLGGRTISLRGFGSLHSNPSDPLDDVALIDIVEPEKKVPYVIHGQPIGKFDDDPEIGARYVGQGCERHGGYAATIVSVATTWRFGGYLYRDVICVRGDLVGGVSGSVLHRDGAALGVAVARYQASKVEASGDVIVQNEKSAFGLVVPWRTVRRVLGENYLPAASALRQPRRVISRGVDRRRR